MVPHIHTTQGVTFVHEGRSISIATDHPNFDKILEALENGWTGRLAGLLEAHAQAIKATVRELDVEGDFTYDYGVVKYRGEVMHNYASTKLVELVEKGRPHIALVNFLGRLQKNPSNRVVERLYKFLEVGQIPLTKNGRFIAYKAIREDWTDIHSGRFDNSIGQTVSVPRNKVDENAEATCSYGLHVCSFSYLPSFAHANGHVVAVVVDPADVVAIPTDYNDSKMRVCEYTVLEEVTDYYKEGKDYLAEDAFYDDAFYEIQANFGHGFERYNEASTFDDAMELAKEAKFDGASETRILNEEGEVIV